MRHKSKVPEQYVAMAERQTSLKIKCIRSDNDLEYNNQSYSTKIAISDMNFRHLIPLNQMAELNEKSGYSLNVRERCSSIAV